MTQVTYATSAYCVKCKVPRDFEGTLKVSDSGRGFLMGRCRVCNTGLNRIASRDQVLFMTDETDDEALWDE